MNETPPKVARNSNRHKHKLNGRDNVRENQTHPRDKWDLSLGKVDTFPGTNRRCSVFRHSARSWVGGFVLGTSVLLDALEHVYAFCVYLLSCSLLKSKSDKWQTGISSTCCIVQGGRFLAQKRFSNRGPQSREAPSAQPCILLKASFG